MAVLTLATRGHRNDTQETLEYGSLGRIIAEIPIPIPSGGGGSDTPPFDEAFIEAQAAKLKIVPFAKRTDKPLTREDLIEEGIIKVKQEDLAEELFKAKVERMKDELNGLKEIRKLQTGKENESKEKELTRQINELRDAIKALEKSQASAIQNLVKQINKINWKRMAEVAILAGSIGITVGVLLTMSMGKNRPARRSRRRVR